MKVVIFHLSHLLVIWTKTLNMVYCGRLVSVFLGD